MIDVVIRSLYNCALEILETRPHDYKRRVCHALKSKGGGPRGKRGGGVAGNVDWQGNVPHPTQYTEEDELYNEYGGRNPLFMPMREDDRRKVTKLSLNTSVVVANKSKDYPVYNEACIFICYHNAGIAFRSFSSGGIMADKRGGLQSRVQAEQLSARSSSS